MRKESIEPGQNDAIESKTDDLGSLISHILDMFQQAL